MPRDLHLHLPRKINTVVKTKTGNGKVLEVGTHNKEKLKEFQRILTDFQIIGKDLKIEEVQSLDPYKVIEEKAKSAFEANDFNPILIEDTSLSIKGLNNFPGTYVNDFLSSIENRRLVATEWLQGKDRSATATVMLGIFDGDEVYTWEGRVEGRISEQVIGQNGFGWDDIFIPTGEEKTFAQMSGAEKDKFSMRTIALKKFAQNPYVPAHIVYELPEPYKQELQRVQIDKLQSKKAIEFAYKLECLEGINKPNNDLKAPNYRQIDKTENSYFSRFLVKKDSYSLGLMLTDIDRSNLIMNKNGTPVLWQMGPERRHLALAQRAEFFMNNQNEEIHKILNDLEKAKFPERTNKRSITIEEALGINGEAQITKAVSLQEIGYKKISSNKEVSRTKTSQAGLFGMIGKYARSIYGIGSLPWVSGWRDVIVMGALAHMPVFIHRNNLNAIDFNNQIELIKSAKDVIASLRLGKKATTRAYNNIGAAIGSNPKDDVKKAVRLYNEAGVKLFRIYTINSDPRIIMTAKNIRRELGDDVEIFVGQIIDKGMAEELISEDIKVDGLIFGHGGGRQCTSATNGMALTTLEELYLILTDAKFNKTSIMIEGGIGTHVGALLVMGVDGILRNAQFANSVIEQGDLFFQHQSGQFCQPYHGSASAATMIIESYDKKNAQTKLFYSGRTKNVEGKTGYIYYEEKANSMSFYIDQFKHYAARTLADLGVDNIYQLRALLKETDKELLRLVSQEASFRSTAWKK